AAVVPDLGRQQRRRAIGAALAVVIAVLALAAFGTTATLWRDWMPILYILIGYRLPALLVTSTNQVFEGRLLTLDRRWRVTTISARAPRPPIGLPRLRVLFFF